MSAVSMDIESSGSKMDNVFNTELSTEDFEHICGEQFEGIDLPKLYNLVWFKNRAFMERD